MEYMFFYAWRKGNEHGYGRHQTFLSILDDYTFCATERRIMALTDNDEVVITGIQKLDR